MRRPLVDLDALTTTAIRRIDVLDRDLKSLTQDVTALGRGVAELTGQIRRLTDGSGSSGGAGGGQPPTSTAPGGPGSPGAEPGPGQRDWFEVEDRDQAESWLADVAEWAGRILPWRRLDLTATACWPIHPDVVEELLALTAQRDDAFAGAKPAAVSEWLTRWLPAGIDRIRTALAPCRDGGGHEHDGRLYDPAKVTRSTAAAWWTGHRDIPAHRALQLPPIH